jgi:hypothetical protein
VGGTIVSFVPQRELVLSALAWQAGEEWDLAYEYLTVGNAQLLATLHHRFLRGPID